MFHSAPVHSASLADCYSRSVSVSLAQRVSAAGGCTRSFIAAIVPPKQGIPRWYLLMLEDRYLRHWTVIARALLDMFRSAVNEPSAQLLHTGEKTRNFICGLFWGNFSLNLRTRVATFQGDLFFGCEVLLAAGCEFWLPEMPSKNN